MIGYRIRATGKRMRAAAARRDRLAEHMAEGGTFADFSRTHGLSDRGVAEVWKAIRDGLGAQAV